MLTRKRKAAETDGVGGAPADPTNMDAPSGLPWLPWELVERIASWADARTLATFAQASVGCRDVARRLNDRPRFVTAYSALPDVDAAIDDVLARTLNRAFMPDAAVVFYSHRGQSTPSMMRRLAQRLPARTQVLGAASGSIIGTNGRSDDTWELDETDSDGPTCLAVAFLRLPRGSVEANSGVPTLPADDHAPPAQAIFMLASVHRSLMPYMHMLGELDAAALKFGGVLATNTGFFVNQQHKRVGMATLVLRGRNLTVHCAVVGREDNVERTLRERVPVGRRYLGCFLVSCYARGKNLHQVANFETRVFHRLYPNVPVIGFFSAGELGPEAGNTKPPYAIHQYGVTSIFTVLECTDVSGEH